MWEIDYLPVGKGSRHGDAIAMRFTQPGGALVHVIIDAGFEENGEALVDHVRRYYNTNAIDLAIVTPLDHHGGGRRSARRNRLLGHTSQDGCECTSGRGREEDKERSRQERFP